MSNVGSLNGGSSGGIAGQLDVTYIVEQIIYSKQQPIRDLQTYETFYTAKKEAFQELNTKLSAVESSLYSINSTGFTLKTASLSSETNLTATAASTASNGSYNIIVKQLAASQSSISGTFASADTQSLSNGKVTIKNYNGTSTLGEVDFSTGTMSLNQLKNQINSLDIGVTATVVNFGSSSSPDYRLQLTSDESGTENGFTIVETDAGGGTLPALTTSIAAKDAQFYVNIDPATSPNQYISRASNTITDVIEGVTLKLKQPADALTMAKGTTLNISADSSGLKDKIDSFVTAFNDAVDFLNAQFTFDEQKQRAGVLSGEAAAVKVKSDLLSLVAGRVGGISDSDNFKSLSVIGISLNKTGKLEVDSTKLDHALSDHIDSVNRLFKNTATSSNAEVEYLGSSSKTEGGTYKVYVKTVAEQAIVTGTDALDTLGQDETLTITYGGKNYTVSLTSGMTSSTVISEINSAMSEAGLNITAQVSSGKLQLSTDDYGSSESISVKSDIAADDADGSTGIGTGTISDTGVDVVGFFKDSSGNTLAATGSGRALTGITGKTRDLVVAIASTSVSDPINGDQKGEVYFTTGVAETLRKRVSEIGFPYTGILARNISALEDQLDNISDKIKSINRTLESEQEILITQFTKANEALSQMTYLQSQLKSGFSS